MTLSELEIQLTKSQIPKNWYSINDNASDETLCIEFNSPNWEVYYSEKGKKTELAFFENEHEACNHFFKRITKWRN
jgi:hypothetical protein